MPSPTPARLVLPALAVLLVLSLAAAGARASALGRGPAEGPRGPVVLLHGVRGGASAWSGLAPILRQRGYDPIVVEYVPDGPDQHLPALAAERVQPAVAAELAARGWPGDSPVSFVGHSTGGLIARFLVEQGGADVEGWDDRAGWHGDGLPDIRRDWRLRTRAVVMLATPNHGAGTGIAGLACRALVKDPFRSLACDVAQGSTFLRRLGGVRPRSASHVPYLAIGSAPPMSYSPGEGDRDGDGLAHGNDGVVVAESPFLPGASFALWRSQALGTHSRLACNGAILGWITDFLDRPAAFPERVEAGRGATARDACRGRPVPESVWAGRGESPAVRRAHASSAAASR